MGRISDVPSFPIGRRGRYSRRRSPGISGIIQRGLRAIDYRGRSNLQIINYDGAYPSLFQVDIGTFVAYRHLSESAAAAILVRMDAAHAECCIVMEAKVEPREEWLGAGMRSEDVEHV
jgi:hypothetical protein